MKWKLWLTKRPLFGSNLRAASKQAHTGLGPKAILSLGPDLALLSCHCCPCVFGKKRLSVWMWCYAYVVTLKQLKKSSLPDFPHRAGNEKFCCRVENPLEGKFCMRKLTRFSTSCGKWEIMLQGKSLGKILMQIFSTLIAHKCFGFFKSTFQHFYSFPAKKMINWENLATIYYRSSSTVPVFLQLTQQQPYLAIGMENQFVTMLLQIFELARSFFISPSLLCIAHALLLLLNSQ